MSVTRVATWKDAKARPAVLLVVDGHRLEIEHDALSLFNTEAKLKAEIEGQAAIFNVQLPKLFFHINRDGSVALAIGAAPDVWPEDDTIEEPR